MAALIIPNDSDALLYSFVDGEDPALIVPTIVQEYVSCTRASVEWHVLRAFLASCKEDRKVATLLRKLVDADSEGGPRGADCRMDEGLVCEGSEVARDLKVSTHE